MKKVLFTFLFLSLIVSDIYSQKEIYFANKSSDSISICSMQGIQVSSNLILNRNMTRVSLPIEIGYFNELKLGQTTSLILSGDIIATKNIKSFTNVLDENGYVIRQNFIYTLGVSFDIQAEPRWYFNFKNQYLTGKKTRLNSGLFLGLPLAFSTTPLLEMYPFQVSARLSPSFGYRYAFTNKFFIEANLRYEIGYYAFISIGTAPYLGLKAAYTFK